MTFAFGIVLLVAALLLWLVPVASLLHKGTDPYARRPWIFTAAAAGWFFVGLFLAAYIFGGRP